MSDGPAGPGWWQASDRRWYPPHDHPDYVASLPPPPTRNSGTRSAPKSTAPRKLTEAERTKILDHGLSSRVRPVITILDGRVRSSGPRIRRSNTSAEIELVTPVTHPAVIVFNATLTLFCFIYGIFWFVKTLRKPQVQTVYIDDYGNQVWGNKAISPAQRVLSVVVGLVLLAGFIWFFHAVSS